MPRAKHKFNLLLLCHWIELGIQTDCTTVYQQSFLRMFLFRHVEHTQKIETNDEDWQEQFLLSKHSTCINRQTVKSLCPGFVFVVVVDMLFVCFSVFFPSFPSHHAQQEIWLSKFFVDCRKRKHVLQDWCELWM